MCWQLPLRRSYERRTLEDGTKLLVVVIGEYTRADWGPGGHDFPWYCSSNTDAHIGQSPVFESSKDEIVALIGPAAYEQLAELCRERVALMGSSGARSGGLSPHPADPES